MLTFRFSKKSAFPQLTEQSVFQIRFEFFNLLNHPNFWQPEPRLNSGNFGQSLEQFDAREIQLGLKLNF